MMGFSCYYSGHIYIERVKNRNSPPAILLRESYRQDGKVLKRTIANLSKWPDDLVEGLQVLLTRTIFTRRWIGFWSVRSA